MSVQRFHATPHGRDFVVGDLHGSFDLLEHALELVDFRPQVDRLFCAGDLIDRGHKSHQVARWLKQPWLHSVKGNHEAMFCDLAPPHGKWDYLQHAIGILATNGMEWMTKHTNVCLNRIHQAFQRLPLAIEIETRHGLIGIVHADVPPGWSWQGFCAALKELDAGETTLHTEAVWSRGRLLESAPVPGIERVYVGHNIVEAPVLMGNVALIDTGAVFHDLGGELTMVNLSAPMPAVRKRFNCGTVSMINHSDICAAALPLAA